MLHYEELKRGFERQFEDGGVFITYTETLLFAQLLPK
jgi:hypothetical protein